MNFPFEIIEHTIPAQHIREWPRATAVSQDDVLQIRIKQYKPIDNPHPQPGDVTVIGAHGNGFPKEVYEPLWSDIYTESKKHGFRIRGIWIADMAHQGRSGQFNKDRLGNDPSWYDHARDLLYMTNVFRAEMPRPLIGIGHSYGGSIITCLALIHARLFSTLILLDPAIHKSLPTVAAAVDMTRLSTFRRNTWPTREAAAAAFRRSPYYSTWDERVLDAWIKHGICKVSGDAAGNEVTLLTSRQQEIFGCFRPLYPYMRADGTVDRDGAPDFDPATNDPPGPYHPFPFYRSESSAVQAQLPHVRPSVLWVYGGSGGIWWETSKMCGSGNGGSGGMKAGRVDEIILKDYGHLFPLEVPGLCAEHAAAWIGQELRRYQESERDYEKWTRLPVDEKTTLSQEFVDAMGRPAGQKKESGTRRQSKI